MSDKVREAFEAWWVAEYESHTYQHADARDMAWEGWQASRAAALEEAVAACNKVARDAVENGLSKPFNFVDGAYHAAKAVRALAGRGA